MGIYSIKNDRWLSEPKQVKANIDDASVEHKYRSYKARIVRALRSDNADQVRRLWNQIRDMRKAGLAQGGEFSPENITFKMLRSEGDLQDLRDKITQLKTAEFSLESL